MMEDPEGAKYHNEINKYNKALEHIEHNFHKATTRKQHEKQLIQFKYLNDRINYLIGQKKKFVPFNVAQRLIQDNDPPIRHKQ